MIFAVVSDLIHAFIIHILLIIIIFFIEGKRRHCIYKHEAERKNIINKLAGRMSHWYSLSERDSDGNKKEAHKLVADEYRKTLSSIADDDEIFKKAGIDMHVVRQKMIRK